MTSPAGTETVRSIGEPRLVIRLQQETHYLANQFVRPRRQPERAFLPVLLRDIHPPSRREPETLMAQRIDNAADLRFGHAIGGLPAGPGCHRSVVGVDAPVGQ